MTWAIGMILIFSSTINHKVLHEEMKRPPSEQLLLQGEGAFLSLTDTHCAL